MHVKKGSQQIQEFFNCRYPSSHYAPLHFTTPIRFLATFTTLVFIMSTAPFLFAQCEADKRKLRKPYVLCPCVVVLPFPRTNREVAQTRVATYGRKEIQKGPRRWGGGGTIQKRKKNIEVNLAKREEGRVVTAIQSRDCRRPVSTSLLFYSAQSFLLSLLFLF